MPKNKAFLFYEKNLTTPLQIPAPRQFLIPGVRSSGFEFTGPAIPKKRQQPEYQDPLDKVYPRGVLAEPQKQ
ncbi:MAG: hypothetical protein ACREHG_01150, partial [Candidatus Saccharimonadales bacterium]